MHVAAKNKPPPGEISVSLRTTRCDAHELECLEHREIEAYVADVKSVQGHITIGHLKLYRLRQARMEQVGPAEMWQQCQVYDRVHFGGKLNKIENFLANESFFEEWQTAIVEAEELIYIEEVILDKTMRGQGLGLKALTQTIAHLRLPARTILLLEPGGIGELECSHEEAGQKLAKHWGRLGFRSWSYTDEAWMCVALNDLIAR